MFTYHALVLQAVTGSTITQVSLQSWCMIAVEVVEFGIVLQYTVSEIFHSSVLVSKKAHKN